MALCPRDDFYADLRDQSAAITNEELAGAYEAHLAEVATVQAEVMAIVRYVSQTTGVRAVHTEGLTEKNVASHRRFITTLATFQASKPTGKTPLEQFLLQEFEQDCLSLGAGGRLAMARNFRVMPLD